MVSISPETSVALSLKASMVQTLLKALGEIIHKEAALVEAEIMSQLEKQFSLPEISMKDLAEAKEL